MAVEEQIQWVLPYVQEGLADIQKENIMEDLESGEFECITVGEFLMDLKKEFEGGNGKTMKVAELKKVKESGTKNKHRRGKQSKAAIALSLAKEIKDSIADASSACTNRES